MSSIVEKYQNCVAGSKLLYFFNDIVYIPKNCKKEYRDYVEYLKAEVMRKDEKKET